MKRFVAFLAVGLLTSCQAAELEIKDAWARATVGGTANAAVFMTISSGTPDRLLGAASPLAGKTDLMTMTSANGAMSMDYLKSIEVPGGNPVSLNPTGLHVWLADLKRPLKAGERIPVTLRFENAGERQVSVAVIAPSAPPQNSQG